MKKSAVLFLCVLFAGIVLGCTTLLEDTGNHHVIVPSGGTGAIKLRAALQPQVSRDNAFALNLFRTMATNSGDSNIVISPLSVSIALGMAWNGTAGSTKAEMTEMLGMNGMTDSLINEYYEVMQKSLPIIDSSTTVSIANSLWYRAGFVVKPSYLQVNANYFNAEIRGLDFSKPWAPDTINAWVDAKTNHLISKIVGRISDNIMMYLINAVYFKGLWILPFNSKETYTDAFTRESGGISDVKMMKKKDTLSYCTDANAQYLDLAYGNGAYSMTILLPVKGKTTLDLLTSLTPESLNKALSNLTTQTVEVYFPRFKTECDFDLVKTLQSMGMKLAFTDQADFTGISDKGLLISDVKHKTYIEVTEEGTKAAAVTSIGVGVTMVPSYPTFLVNKPFLFFIREKGTGVILFAGKMSDLRLF